MDAVEVDAVFGFQGEGHVHYTSMGWMQAAVILLKTQVGLGVLAMPSMLQMVGAVPGTLIIVGLGILTTWCDYVVGTFKRNHPEVYSVADAGYIMFGTFGRELFSFAYWCFTVGVAGAAMVAISIAFNAITDHATCTVVWVVIAAVVAAAAGSIQTLNRISWISWVGVIGIFTAVIMVTIAVGVQERPAAAPPTGPWDKDTHAFISAPIWDVISVMSTVLFSYSGTPAFFGVISEMKNPRDYNKSLAVCQFLTTGLFTAIGVVVYFKAGQYLSSPALGSAGPLIKKVAYGIALAGLWASAILFVHCAAKLIFVRVMRNSPHLTALTPTHYIVWFGTTITCATLAFLLAESIPFFGSLLGLIGALFSSLMTLQATGWMWLFDNWHRRKNSNPGWDFWPLVVLNVFIIVLGFFIQIMGTVAAGMDIRNQYRKGAVDRPFSCKDNSK
ncbi:hypothetical protein VHUM_02369 [Vanrija humicola]|uniref:Amino acid transporter transmembrane domain-containing protein n=1 Tax=Vanrija humicola TaxID=5417 RepID=A0A7D8ZQM6_VANHU|nr:hypothetical protein VHUM_02369 [Vanrija humicola]